MSITRCLQFCLSNGDNQYAATFNMTCLCFRNVNYTNNNGTAQMTNYLEGVNISDTGPGFCKLPCPGYPRQMCGGLLGEDFSSFFVNVYQGILKGSLCKLSCCIISDAGYTYSFHFIFLVRMRRLAGRIENQQKLTYNSYTKYGAVFDNGQQLNTDLVDRRRNLYQSNKLHITFSDVLGSSWDEIAQTKVRLNGYLSVDQKLFIIFN